MGDAIREVEACLTDRDVAAYDAPYPDATFKVGVRAFPSLLMVEPDMAGVEESRAAESFWRDRWGGETFMAVGALDPSMGLETMQHLRETIRGCPEPMILSDASHFVQEHGEAIARAALVAFS